MSTDFVWVNGFRCKNGHDLGLESNKRDDYRGYPATAVPLEVAEDLRANPSVCYSCYRSNPLGHEHPMVGDASRYRVQFLSEPRNVCEGCGAKSSCGCYKVVAVDIEVLPPLPACAACNGSGWGCSLCEGTGRRALHEEVCP